MANNLIKLEDVYFAFTSIAEPKNKYKSTIEKEYATTVVLSKEQSREFKKLKLNKTVKETPTDEFEAKFKFAPPYPDQEDQYTISVTKPATYQDGNSRPDWTFPKAYFVNEDGKVVEASSTLIGNGSFGNISLETRYSEALKSTSISLNSVLIKNLVPFVKTQPGAEWADVGEVVAKPRSTSTVTTTSSVPSQDVELDDDLPF